MEAVGWDLADAEAECEAKGRAARRYVDFEYATRKTWSKKRRVVGKAEWLPGKANPRFVATFAAPLDGPRTGLSTSTSTVGGGAWRT